MKSGMTSRKLARISTGGRLPGFRAGRPGATPPGRGLAGCAEGWLAAVAGRLCRVYGPPRRTAWVQGRATWGNTAEARPRGLRGALAGRRCYADFAAFIDRRLAGRRNRDLSPLAPSAKSSAATTAAGHRATPWVPGAPVQNGMSSSAKLLSASPPPAGASGPAAGLCAGAGPALAAALPGESPAPLRLLNICISLATTSVV